MSVDTVDAAVVDEASVGMLAHESMRTILWRRFRRHPGAMAGIVILAVMVLAVVFAGLSPYDPEDSDMPNRLQPPSLAHPFGTDQLGRDLFTRCLYGGRVSLSVGLMVVAITLLIGVPDQDVADALAIIKANCRTRLAYASPLPPTAEPLAPYASAPIEVRVGGAVVFVLDVERFERY